VIQMEIIVVVVVLYLMLIVIVVLEMIEVVELDGDLAVSFDSGDRIDGDGFAHDEDLLSAITHAQECHYERTREESIGVRALGGRRWIIRGVPLRMTALRGCGCVIR